MPTHTITYELPDERDELTLAMEGVDMHCVLWSFLERDLRSKLKHGHDFESPDEALKWVQDTLLGRLAEYGVDIHDVN